MLNNSCYEYIAKRYIFSTASDPKQCYQWSTICSALLYLTLFELFTWYYNVGDITAIHSFSIVFLNICISYFPGGNKNSNENSSATPDNSPAYVGASGYTKRSNSELVNSSKEDKEEVQRPNSLPYENIKEALVEEQQLPSADSGLGASSNPSPSPQNNAENIGNNCTAVVKMHLSNKIQLLIE